MSLLNRSILKLRSLASNAVHGHLGSCEGRIVSGWAIDPADPSAALTVTFRAAGVLVGTALANQFREDLKAAGVGLGHGRYAFKFHIPATYRPTASFQLSAEVAGRSALPGSPLTIEQLPDDTIIGHIDGCVDGVLSGWAYIPQDPGQALSVAIEHEGRLLGSVPAITFRGDLRKLGVCSDRGLHGFRFPIPPEIRALGTYTLTVKVEGGPPLEGSPITVAENLDQTLPVDGSIMRSSMASQYLQGDGLEIGAFNHPMNLPPWCSVRYVDALTTEQLRRQYPAELQTWDVVDVDIVSDAHILNGVEDGSQDFVIANHVLEHLGDPLLALRNMLRVLRTGGVLFLAVPDKRYTFDKDRPCTTFEHLLQDHGNGSEASREAHYLEWLRVVLKLPEPEVAERMRVLREEPDFGIHLHVWSEFEILDMLKRAREVIPLNYELACFQANGAERISVLRRQGAR